jgi:hypothetical protein
MVCVTMRSLPRICEMSSWSILVSCEQRGVLVLESVAQPDVSVDVAQVAVAHCAGGAEQVRLEQLAAYDAGVLHRGRRVAEQLAQFGDGLRVGRRSASTSRRHVSSLLAP